MVRRIQAFESRVFGGMDQSAERIAHKSGNTGVISVVIKYWAPADPPVPILAPMVRWTILTWR